ncbi:MAG: hypothetical protein GXX82_10595 [Syntrophorhabdus sp.]|nr:hypothetical protein [Syntrophorhabdus sp.]
MTPSHCSTCGREIQEGKGRYVTAEGVYCLQCGLPFPLGPQVKVQIIITGLEDRLEHKQQQEVTYGN